MTINNDKILQLPVNTIVCLSKSTRPSRRTPKLGDKGYRITRHGIESVVFTNKVAYIPIDPPAWIADFAGFERLYWYGDRLMVSDYPPRINAKTFDYYDFTKSGATCLVADRDGFLYLGAS